MAKNWKDFIEDDELNTDSSISVATSTNMVIVKEKSSKDENLNKLLKEQKQLEDSLKKLTNKDKTPNKFDNRIPSTAQRKKKEQKWLQYREKTLKKSFTKKLELKNWEKKREVLKNSVSKTKKSNDFVRVIANKTIVPFKKEINIQDKLDKRNANAKKRLTNKIDLINWEKKREKLKKKITTNSKPKEEEFIRKNAKKSTFFKENEKIGFEKIVEKPKSDKKVKKALSNLNLAEEKWERIKEKRQEILSQKKKYEKLAEKSKNIVNDTKLFDKREALIKQKIADKQALKKEALKIAKKALIKALERKEEQKKERQKQSRLERLKDKFL